LNVRTRRRQRRRRAGLLVVAAAVVMGVGILWRGPIAPAPSNHSVMSVVVVAAAHEMLPDGSTVDLKEGAEVEIAFTPGVRAVTLRRGMARFQVAKNPQRPFVVTAGDVSVRAVGTAFCVGLESKSVEVIVTEGRVSVAQSPREVGAAPSTVNPPCTALVGAGENVVVGPNSGQPLAVALMDTQEMANKLFWLNPRLEFTGTPLEMVVMTFNQHNRRQLVLEDPELRNLQLSGILRSDNIPALLNLLETNFHIQAEFQGNQEILLRKAP
jgi:transmembrane sensor